MSAKMLSVNSRIIQNSFRMYHSGLLVLTSPASQVLSSVPKVLSEATKFVKDTLYIHLAPGLNIPSNNLQIVRPPCTTSVNNLVTKLYSQAADHHQALDLRVVIGNLGISKSHPRPPIEEYQFVHICDVILTDVDDDSFKTTLAEYVGKYFPSIASSAEVHKIDFAEEKSETDANEVQLLHQYENICMGGTFDRLHTGHKILLSHAAMLTTERLIVGVTTGNMTDTKTLPELIEPSDIRIKATKDFLEDVKPQVIYEVVPIEDPYGPSITDPNIQCIVVSQETERGGTAINRKRLERGMSELVVDVIDLVEDTHHEHGEEQKISSSSQRRRLLGTLLRQPETRPCDKPYIIGLTGGIASGKSSVCKRLEKLGAAVIDCDRLGHQSYSKDGAAYAKVVDTFGEDILDKDGNIDRKVLGPKVFGNSIAREALNNIVWPVIQDMARSQVEQYHKDGYSVVILDAAILLEAEWDTMTNEVWTTIIPRDEAVKRIVQRNNLSEEAALERIKSQMSNKERVDRANVVLCTFWEYEVTQRQVEKAWKLLHERLPK